MSEVLLENMSLIDYVKDAGLVLFVWGEVLLSLFSFTIFQLQGVDAMSEVLLENMSLVDYVKDAGLVLFVWGEANNDTDTINSFKEKGVDAIIYDRYGSFFSIGPDGHHF